VLVEEKPQEAKNCRSFFLLLFRVFAAVAYFSVAKPLKETSE